MDESFQPPPEGVNAKPNGGVKKQRSNLRDMMVRLRKVIDVGDPRRNAYI